MPIMMILSGDRRGLWIGGRSPGVTGRLLPSRLGHGRDIEVLVVGMPAAENDTALDQVKEASWTDWRADQRCVSPSGSQLPPSNLRLMKRMLSNSCCCIRRRRSGKSRRSGPCGITVMRTSKRDPVSVGVTVA
jgi:hypothetical protein